jgi:hypothetical protein
MHTVSETIAYAVHVKPLRYGLGWLATSLAITLPGAMLFLRSDIVEFLFVCCIGVLPAALIAFTSPWSRARDLARKSVSATIGPSEIEIAGDVHALTDCRWFRGYAFHDPRLALYPAYTPAVVITWPPFTPTCRMICGLSPQQQSDVIEILKRESIPEDKPRLSHERLLINAAALLGGVCTAAAAVGVNLISALDIPFTSIATSVGVGGLAACILIKHHLGHFQFQEPLAKAIGPWLGFATLGLLRLNRKNRGGPLHADPSFLVWVLPLVALQTLGMIWMYHAIREREDQLLAKRTGTGDNSPRQ